MKKLLSVPELRGGFLPGAMPRRRDVISCLFIGLFLASAIPCFAGTTYKTEMRTEAGPMGFSMKTQAWASNGAVKMLFVESQNPAMPAGSYMLRKPGSTALYMVSPSSKTYSVWNIQNSFGDVSAEMRTMMKVENPKFEKVVEDDGGTVAGFVTRHYVFRLTYTMVVDTPESQVKMPVVMDQEYWASDDAALSDLKNASLLQSSGMLDGVSSLSPELESMMAEQTKQMRGAALRSTLRITAKAPDRPEQPISMTMTISELRHTTVPASTFSIPAGYRKTAPKVALPSHAKRPVTRD
jgi:hypothetical protein